MTKTDQILDHMRQHPVPWRARPLAKALYGQDVSTDEVTRLIALMKGLADQGRLVRCKVEIPGEIPQFEYRISASGSLVRGDIRNYKITRNSRAVAPQESVGGGDRPARKVRAVKPSKKQRKSARRGLPPALLIKTETTYGVSPHRWALTSDGAFVLLGTQTEIQKPAARALVEFVRTLDAGEA